MTVRMTAATIGTAAITNPVVEAGESGLGVAEQEPGPDDLDQGVDDEDLPTAGAPV